MTDEREIPITKVPTALYLKEKGLEGKVDMVIVGFVTVHEMSMSKNEIENIPTPNFRRRVPDGAIAVTDYEIQKISWSGSSYRDKVSHNTLSVTETGTALIPNKENLDDYFKNR